MRPYLDPHDHAFANGPVFQRPRNAAEARGMFDRAEDGDRLMEVFDAFLSRADVGEGLRLGLSARLITPDGERRARFGRDCAIRGIIRCEGEGRAAFGERVYLGDGAVVSARRMVEIGDSTLIAHGGQVFDNDTHPLDPAEREAHFRSILKIGPRREFDIPTAAVCIGRRCWLGFSAAVMKGVTLGDGCIVAAGAVVTASAPEGATLAGNPARAVRRRGEGGLFGRR